MTDLSSFKKAFFVPPNAPKPPNAVPGSFDRTEKFCECDKRKGQRCAFCWAWEPSDSLMSAWSNATSKTNQNGSAIQRVLGLKPDRCRPGENIIVTLREEILQEHWQILEISLTQNDHEHKIKPSGIQKGKRIAFRLPPEFPAGDYDLVVQQGELKFPGRLVLEVLAIN
jgi:hypothetical protein